MQTQVQDVHSRGLVKASTLTSFQVVDAIAPLDVIKILNRNRISFVLVGAYGLVGWTKEPRATQDVDVLVAARQHKKTVNLLVSHFPQLEPDDQEVVTRLRDRGTQEVAIDVMRPNALYREAFKHTVWVEAGSVRYRVPSLEMALAMKFAPMTSLARVDEKKHQDASDFIKMVKQNAEIDLSTLAEFGELVYPGGSAEILELVRKIRAGEKHFRL